MKNYQSVTDAINDLRKRGYEADFEQGDNCLYCSGLDMRIAEESFQIDEVYSFEGNPNPDDNAVVYALTSPGGLKGTRVEIKLY